MAIPQRQFRVDEETVRLMDLLAESTGLGNRSAVLRFALRELAIQRGLVGPMPQSHGGKGARPRKQRAKKIQKKVPDGVDNVNTVVYS